MMPLSPLRFAGIKINAVDGPERVSFAAPSRTLNVTLTNDSDGNHLDRYAPLVVDRDKLLASAPADKRDEIDRQYPAGTVVARFSKLLVGNRFLKRVALHAAQPVSTLHPTVFYRGVAVKQDRALEDEGREKPVLDSTRSNLLASLIKETAQVLDRPLPLASVPFLAQHLEDAKTHLEFINEFKDFLRGG